MSNYLDIFYVHLSKEVCNGTLELFTISVGNGVSQGGVLSPLFLLFT